MMTEKREKLLKLAERCETATGPDHSLDNAIANTIRLPLLKGDPAYTASFDAAMTLVPKGWAKYVADDEYGCHACVWARTGDKMSRGCKNAATAALALCAAALRARAGQ